MGLLPGDEMVADYLARVGRTAARSLPPARSADLGDPESLVAAAESGPDRGRGFPVAAPEDDDLNATADLGPIWAQGENAGGVRVAPAEDEPVRRRLTLPGGASRGGGSSRGGGRNGDVGSISGLPSGLAVRPSSPNEERGPDRFTGLGRLRWELAALAVLGGGVFAAGLLAWLLGAALVVRSPFFQIRDKVRALLGLPAAALTVAVLWAWLEATQLQESEDSGARISTAGHSLAESFQTMPAIFGVGAAAYLAYALVRDHHVG